MTPESLLSLIPSGGATAVLTTVLWLLLKGSLVSGRQYTDTLRDRDDWKEIALSTASAAERAVDLAERRRKDRGRDARGTDGAPG